MKRISKYDKIKVDFTPELAEIMGIILGDGGLYLDKRNHYHTIISFNKEETDYLRHVKNLLETHFYPYRFHVYETHHTFIIQNVSVYLGKQLLGAGMKVGDKIRSRVVIPGWVLEKNFLVPFIRGFFDTDGCVYKKYGNYAQIQFKLGSIPLLISVKKALTKLGFTPTKIQKDINSKKHISWKIYLVRQNEIKLFFQRIKPKNDKHIKRYLKIIKSGDAEI